MAESAAITFLLEKLADLLKYYSNVVSGSENELELLTKDLKLMKAFLLEADKRSNKEEQLKELVRQIRQVVYDAEDTIDSCFITKAQKKRPRLNVRSVSLAERVKSLREKKIKPLLDGDRLALAMTQIGEVADSSSRQSKGKLNSIPKADNVVGLKDQEEILMKYIIDEKRNELDVISIIGMPGLGKTTLAWKIYKSKMIEFTFQTRIWIYVSQDLNPRDVLLSIAKGYTKEDLSNSTDMYLYERVRDYLSRGSFFIVLDDVWSVADWNEIEKFLPNDNKTGKVLLTSRNSEVGRHANVSRAPHELRFLTDAESWELLQLEVFRRADACPPELKETGERIARQCGGLPLAVVVIGGILIDLYLSSDAQPIGEIKEAWKKVSENASEHMKSDKHQRVKDIVSMSYDKLTGDLKSCFIYMGVFPEDHEIDSWTLCRLWIAEGFVENISEKIAEEKLNELINRNLVMAGKRKPNGRVKTCRVHDVIRSFCITKAGVDEHNLFTEIKFSRDHRDFEPPVSDLQSHRRLSVRSNLEALLQKFMSERIEDLKIRSFLCFHKESQRLDPKYFSIVANACNFLRVLDSSPFKFNTFPNKVTNLIHLRFITLSFDEHDILPGSVSELWNLQTLVIDTKSPVLKVKAHIWEMLQLRHLKTKASIVLVGQKDGKGGQNLQTLSRLSPENCTRDVFRKASNLKMLGIRGRLGTLLSSTNNSLNELVRVEKLKLVHDILPNDPLHSLPEHNRFPPNLKHLTLSNTYLNWKHISTLGMIVGLQVLKLKNNAFIGGEWNTTTATGGGFSNLRFLLIAHSDLALWETSADHFPDLRCLVLKSCRKLETIPLCLADAILEVLDIDGVTPSAVESAKEIETRKNVKLQGQGRGGSGAFKLIIAPYLNGAQSN